MADVTTNRAPTGEFYRLKDMGDGTFAPVVMQAAVRLGAAVNSSSGNVAAAAAVATLAAAAGLTTYITGFEITAAGATAGLVVNVTVTGLLGGTLTFAFAFPAGVLIAATPLVVPFPRPLPASAPNTAIVVTCPSGGAGNTNAAANAHGFQA